MPEFYYIPLYIFPNLPITRLKILPGLSIEKCSKKVNSRIDHKIEAWGLGAKTGYSFNPNYNIKIVVKDYDTYQRIEAVKNFGEEEFKKTITKSPDLPDWVSETRIRPPNAARHAILSLSLFGLYKFKFGGYFHFDSNLKIGGFSNYPIQSSNLLGHIKCKGENFKRKRISQIAQEMNVYFGPYIWQMDRLSLALSSMWAALCTNQVEQSFLSLTTALEAILTTQAQEITHQLAERASFLLCKEPSERYATYKDIKSIYKTRSKIVHGKAFLSKKGMDRESIFISLGRSRVPETDFSNLFRITQKVIKACFENNRFRTIIQAGKSEKKISDEIDEYFIGLITGTEKIS